GSIFSRPGIRSSGTASDRVKQSPRMTSRSAQTGQEAATPDRQSVIAGSSTAQRENGNTHRLKPALPDATPVNQAAVQDKESPVATSSADKGHRDRWNGAVTDFIGAGVAQSERSADSAGRTPVSSSKGAQLWKPDVPAATEAVVTPHSASNYSNSLA